jgi:hypothetical protein
MYPGSHIYALWAARGDEPALCLYQIESSGPFKGLFAKKKIAKNTQPPISVAASHFPHFYSWNHLGVL